ncbi:hypothetical protein [Spirosoma pulveris]
MRNTIALFAAASCLFFSSCQRPVAYFQPTAHPAAARLSTEKVGKVSLETPDVVGKIDPESSVQQDSPAMNVPQENANRTTELAAFASPAVASRTARSGQTTASRLEHRIQRVNALLSLPETQTTDQQPGPKPKKKLKLGNQIRQSLGMKLRPELNWWQRISWKLKASVFVILVAVVFAILHITVLAIIFGIVGAFLLISGLKRSFKVRRPWF